MANDILSINVASKIEELRAKKGLSQEELAYSIGMSRASLANMEAGRQSISLFRLFAISEALQVEAKELLPNNEWYRKYKGKKLRKEIRFVLEDE